MTKTKTDRRTVLSAASAALAVSLPEWLPWSDGDRGGDDLETRVDELETELAALQDAVADNQTAITDTAVRVDDNESTLTDHDGRISDLEAESGGESLWESAADGFLKPIDAPGSRVSEGGIGHARLDSFGEEEGTFMAGSGETLIELENTYRLASASIGADQGDGAASWFGWERNADDEITGVWVSHNDSGLTGDVEVIWHIVGNETEASYNS